MQSSQPIRVRIAPSPTGDPHVGTAYMALFNLIFARHFQGKFILRIEDTDRTRSRLEYEQSIYEALNWAGISWDEGPDKGGPYGPYRQSERFALYQEHATLLLDRAQAYPCFCNATDLADMRAQAAQTGGRQGYDRRCRHLTPLEVQQRKEKGQPFVIRLKVPLEGECVYDDLIKGHLRTPWADIDDQILLKSDGFPTYHLANVVDDHLMQISHVIRGDEWMTSTPKHIQLYQAFGWQPPFFLHMPLLLGKEGKKLSKRKNPTSIFFYRDSGYLPEAFINFLTLMGYSMPENKEIYTVDEIIQAFDYKRIGLSGAIFDVQKLDWLNQQYLIHTIPIDQLWPRLKEWSFNDAFMQKLMPLIHPRLKTFGDFIQLCDFMFINQLKYMPELFTIKGLSSLQLCGILQSLIWQLDEQENWQGSGLQTATLLVAERYELHYKKMLMPLLFASLMGKLQGPPLFDSADILGKDRVRARFLNTIEFLGGLSQKKSDLLKKGWENKTSQQFKEL